MQNRAECSYPKRLVIGYRYARKRLIASEDNMASPLPLDNKSNSLKCLNQFTTGEVSRQSRHLEPADTSTYSLPSSAGIGSPAAMTSSKYSSIASSIFLRASSRESPCETQPGKAGTETTYPPSLSRCKITVYFIWGSPEACGFDELHATRPVRLRKGRCPAWTISGNYAWSWERRASAAERVSSFLQKVKRTCEAPSRGSL